MLFLFYSFRHYTHHSDSRPMRECFQPVIRYRFILSAATIPAVRLAFQLPFPVVQICNFLDLFSRRMTTRLNKNYRRDIFCIHLNFFYPFLYLFIYFSYLKEDIVAVVEEIRYGCGASPTNVSSRPFARTLLCLHSPFRRKLRRFLRYFHPSPQRSLFA